MTVRSPEPRWLTIYRLLRWDKPAGRLILMIPALWAVVLAAQGAPPLPLVGVIVVGTLATSAAGCVANDLWDRDIDPQVERTSQRPLAARSLSIQTGVVVGAIALLCAAGLALYLNPLSFWLCGAAVPFILLYPGAKRVFPVPQLVLALAWGFAVLISWAAVTGSLTQATGWLWGAVLLWTLGFDTVYAMSDREDDAKIGIYSSALFFGRYAPVAVGVFFLGTAGLLAELAVILTLHWSFWLTWAIALLGWLWQTWQLQRPDLPRPLYGQIFSQNVIIGFILLIGMITGSLLMG
ncbi:4-hydroxybenzoate solanesyltransferase [Spirulina major CS-329]|uniref:4-hydroxybenzoate solanesyltransferase n=1 Tax=Spirulina TaxID=1154 RepID=UPI00232B24FD|nr:MULTISPECIES: 4-hydroxybenzoate solanesyltransferase [Spirulina]MDB9495794.1 4-hydroxybenzoate solanesyltransferase [Spirulina subsalsa CS-330]MDB9503780.1 4-hydroxybenzoate solanesyltransferase [Spirulina major CS-329]